MNIKNTIISHYKNFFDLHAKGIALDEDDHLNIDWAEDLVKNCFIPNVMQWVAVKERLPKIGTKTDVWISAGHRVTNYTWEDFDLESSFMPHEITHWMPIPEPPCA